MKINGNNNISKITISNRKSVQNGQNDSAVTYPSQKNILSAQLNNIAFLNQVNFTAKKYEIGLDKAELKRRTDLETFRDINLLDVESDAYQNLEEGDKKALVHLVKAADLIGEVELQLDDENNIPFRKYLKREIAKDNPDAKLVLELFKGQKGIFAKDLQMKEISLVKGLKQSPGRGVYPRDLSVKEFHEIINRMLDERLIDDVKQILTQRSVVKRDGEYLKGIDYVDNFRNEFLNAAEELEKAAELSTNEDFNEYLRLQAKALQKADPMLDAYADKKWAQLQDTPLEFTITRENYEDKMTETIFRNKELLNKLNSFGITPIAKDFLGGRVGIVNREGTEYLLKSKEALPILAQLMPFADEYEQIIDNDNKQTMVDVDLIELSGAVGEHRGKITLAENLPNSDKLSLTIGGGRRNVYHKTLRNDKSKSIEMYKNVLDSQQVKYLTENDYHYFTVGHENAHTLGAHKNNAKLGEYRNILEENKADVAAISFVDKLTELGFYTQKERKGILTNFVLYNFLLAKPDMSVAHRVRQVMQCKYLADNGAYYINDEGKIHVNIDKVVPICRKMLEEVVRIQIDGDYDAAEDYVNRNFIWTDDMEYISNILKEQSNTLNKILRTPLADFLRNN